MNKSDFSFGQDKLFISENVRLKNQQIIEYILSLQIKEIEPLEIAIREIEQYLAKHFTDYCFQLMYKQKETGPEDNYPHISRTYSDEQEVRTLGGEGMIIYYNQWIVKVSSPSGCIEGVKGNEPTKYIGLKVYRENKVYRFKKVC